MSPTKPKQLTELKVTCTSVDCENGLHCFLQAKREAQAHGACRECGVDLVDWDRVHARNRRDVPHTFASLRNERVRHHFWHLELSQHAINYARRKGYKGLEEATRQRVRSSIAKAEPYRDGAQTPLGGPNPIFYGQHATATCCRRCFEYWHGVSPGSDLKHDEIEYAADLLMQFLRLRLPNLTENGEYVPPIRKGG